jgi:hypothetical protein
MFPSKDVLQFLDKTVNVHLYTTDSREMSDNAAQRLPRFRLAGNANHAKFPLLDQALRSRLAFNIIMTCPKLRASRLTRRW